MRRRKKEVWKKVPGFPGYQVSDRGRVEGNRGRILKQSKGTSGYSQVGPSKNGKGTTQIVHRLVLIAFRGKPKPGQVCRHLDGNRANNKLDNLRWGTRKENEADKVRHGTGNRGERNGQSKLTEKQVLKIRELYHEGYIYTELAKLYNVSEAMIGFIIKGTHWKNVGGSIGARSRKKLTDAQVQECRVLREKGYTLKKIADMFDVSFQLISLVTKR